MFSSNTTQESGGYEIQRSLRFNSADTAYLNRTPASAGNRRTWTWSGWVKRGKIGDWAYLFQGTAGNPTGGLDDGTAIRFSSVNNQLTIYNLINGSNDVEISTAAVFRDPSAWYHIVAAVDTTQATASDRVKLYVNNVQATSFTGTTYPSQNADLYVNTTNAHVIGALIRDAGSPQLFNDGLMTEINLIDGQALTPSSFGETNADTGVWQPKRYAGSYGTNGFYLNFSNNSNTTAATLGADYSGNGNNWTPNNFSVTAGSGNDSLVDVPTNFGVDTGVGGTVRGNYCTLNPLARTDANFIPTNGNLDGTTTSSTSFGYATFGVSSGKWYWEVVPTTADGMIGIGRDGGIFDFRTANGYGYFSGNGQKYTNGTGASYGATYTTNDIIGVALDMDAGTLTFLKNGTSQGVAFSSLSGTFFASVQNPGNSTTSYTYNFGQRPFAYTAPSGFKALNTQNLPTPTIGATPATQAGKFFNPVLYTGNGFPTSGTQSVTGVGFQPDWVWIKNRSNEGSHTLTDVVRGINSQLLTNTTGAQQANTDNITALNSDGFSLGSNTTGNTNVNVNTQTYVAWNWKANGAGVTNTAGSITSTVSANTTSGFSVVTYTGTGANATVGHGLGAAPSMIILKMRSAVQNWVAYHQSLGNTKALFLDLTDAAATSSLYWNNTSPSSSVITLGSGNGTNANGSTYVAYCFAEVPGYSKFGSYTGNGSTDGPFVFCGFRPRYIMVKGSTNSSNWTVIDTARDSYNTCTSGLYPNLSAAQSDPGAFDILSNGFKIRHVFSDSNGNGNTYIFAAFAESPQKFALAR
jgi:hypothetical protein